MTKHAFFKGIITYCIITLCFLSANSIVKNVPLGCALLIGFLYSGYNPFALIFCFLSSLISFNSLSLVFCAFIFCLLVCMVFAIYKTRKIYPRLEIAFYVSASLLPFIFWGGEILTTLAYSAIICLFSILSTYGLKAITNLYIKAKSSKSTLICFSLTAIFVSYGFINLFGLSFYKALSVFVLLFFEKLKRNNLSAIISQLIAVAPSLIFSNGVWFMATFLWFACSQPFMPRSKILSALALIVADIFVMRFLNIYLSFQIIEVFFVAIPALFFAFLPEKLFAEIAFKTEFNSREVLAKNYLNRSRLILSSKLYEISGVFFQMHASLTELKDASLSHEKICNVITDECIKSVCGGCIMKERCSARALPERDKIYRFCELGIKKGRVSLIDFPLGVSEYCSNVNSMIFEVNRLISKFFDKIKELDESSGAKEIVSLSTQGLGSAIKALALETSKTLAESKDVERLVIDTLKQNAITCCGAMVLGEGEETEINIITSTKHSNSNLIISALSKAVGENLVITQKTPFSESLVCVTLKRAPKLDAVFGVSSITKSGSNYCGDTHSLIKISESKFLVALSDGMGSGEKAYQTSSTTLSLIESFYRAGLSSSLVFSTINKILALTTDDNFSAVDVGVVDLCNLKLDLIKIGAPYGFVLSESGVKFIEGSSLPLGILDELSPKSLNLEVCSGDVIVLISDGISEAFGSSADMVEFLSTAPRLNPQNLSDTIIQKALSKTGGRATDDMTAVCVRLIDKVV